MFPYNAYFFFGAFFALLAAGLALLALAPAVLEVEAAFFFSAIGQSPIKGDVVVMGSNPVLTDNISTVLS